MGKKITVVNPSKTDIAVKPTAVASVLTIKPAGLVDDGSSAIAEIAGLPEEWRKAETLSGFLPSPEWKERGETVFGDYIGTRTEVGPNKSRLYELAAHQGEGKEPLSIAVWGTTALDRLFDSAYPPVCLGDKLAIIYLGEKETARGMNPVKLFALKIARVEKKEVYSNSPLMKSV